MIHNEEFLHKLSKSEISGDFSPFLEKKELEVEMYIRKIVARLNKIHNLKAEADFNNYGSGYASYVPIQISKKDRTDTEITQANGIVHEDTSGILLGISKLSAYWYYGGSLWRNSYRNKKWASGSYNYPCLEGINHYDKAIWRKDITLITQILQEYRYSLLTCEELALPLTFDVDIPTIFGAKPYQVFDCFFYWED